MNRVVVYDLYGNLVVGRCYGFGLSQAKLRRRKRKWHRRPVKCAACGQSFQTHYGRMMHVETLHARR